MEAELQTKLSDPGLMFVAAVEPHAEVGDGWFGAQAALIRQDGTAVQEVVIAKESGFGLAPLSRAMSLNESAISHRKQFVPVLSRIRGELFIVGGTDLASGQLTRQIWSLSNSAAPQRIELPSYAPELALAATVAPSDRMLWILDEIPGRGLKTSRLVRIDLETLNVEVVWQGRRPGLFDQHWLSVDRDGQVLLFASSSKTRKHVTVRFEAQSGELGTARPVVVRFGQGELYGEPLVDAGGYEYVVKGKKGTLSTYRVSDLMEPAPGPGPFDLSGCL